MSENAMIQISLVICTRDRVKSLEVCFEHLTRLDMPSDAWELVVVDNASSDSTSALVSEYARVVPFKVILVQEPRPGLGRARRTGTRRAKGSLIAYTDDDCYVRPDFLQQICNRFEAEPDLGFIGGQVALYDRTDAPITTIEEPERFEIPARGFIPAGLVHGANMAARRAVIDAIDSFDPMLGAGTPFPCEDVDFLARASALGWRGAYCPSVFVYHHHGRKPGPAVDKLEYKYAIGRGAYMLKCLFLPSVRSTVIKNIYWSAQSLIQCRKYRILTLEVAGALKYLLVAGLHKVTFRRRWDPDELPAQSATLTT
jgi:GT2 family glycosyltransferase